MQLGHHTMIPSHIPDYFSQANDFEINSCQKSRAAENVLLLLVLSLALFFAPNALWWWAWGWRRFLWSISEKKLGLMVVSPISFSLQFCMLSRVLKSISSWQLVKSQRPPQKASSTHPLWLSSREKKKKNIIFSEEKKPASSSTQVQYCPTYLRDSIDPADNLTLGIIIKRLTWYFHTTCQSICVSVNLFFEGSWTLYVSPRFWHH